MSRGEGNIKMDLTEIGWEAVQLGYRQMEGCCEHGNEHSGSIKCGECLE